MKSRHGIRTVAASVAAMAFLALPARSNAIVIPGAGAVCAGLGTPAAQADVPLMIAAGIPPSIAKAGLCWDQTDPYVGKAAGTAKAYLETKLDYSQVWHGTAAAICLNPTFATRLAAFLHASDARFGKGGIIVVSGYRPVKVQVELVSTAKVACKSGEECPHVQGRAADLHFATEATRAWAHADAANYQLVFPLANDTNHIEPAERSSSDSVANKVCDPSGGINTTFTSAVISEATPYQEPARPSSPLPPAALAQVAPSAPSAPSGLLASSPLQQFEQLLMTSFGSLFGRPYQTSPSSIPAIPINAAPPAPVSQALGPLAASTPPTPVNLLGSLTTLPPSSPVAFTPAPPVGHATGSIVEIEPPPPSSPPVELVPQEPPPSQSSAPFSVDNSGAGATGGLSAPSSGALEVVSETPSQSPSQETQPSKPPSLVASILNSLKESLLRAIDVLRHLGRK